MEVSTRPWLYDLSLKYGKNLTKLSDIPMQEFQAFKDQGVDYVWLMGVWSLGPYGLTHDTTDPSLLASYSQVLPGYKTEDIIGSPYAVRSYVVNPALGTDDDLAALRTRLRSIGLRLALDFVPNHSAVDCPQTTQNKEYYVYSPDSPFSSDRFLPNGVAFGSCGSDCIWTDTAQYNYWNPATVKARLADLQKVASLADMVRCDVAWLALNDAVESVWGPLQQRLGYSRPSREFWEFAISTVKAAYPDVLFLGEVYDEQSKYKLQQLGFDFTYEKELLDQLAAAAYTSPASLDKVRAFLDPSRGHNSAYTFHSAHMLSNHDEPSEIVKFGSWWKADAAALATYTLPGLRFVWYRQVLGYANRLDVHLRRGLPEPVNPSTVPFYAQLLGIVNDPAFKYGQWTWRPIVNSDAGWRLMAWSWRYQDHKRLCVINFSDAQAGGFVVVDDATPTPAGNNSIPVTDLLSGQTFTRSASEMRSKGLYVQVNAWYAQIFSY